MGELLGMLPVSTDNILLAFSRAMLLASSPMMLCYAAFLDGVPHQRVYLHQAIGNFVIASVPVERLHSSHERTRRFPLTTSFRHLLTLTKHRVSPFCPRPRNSSSRRTSPLYIPRAGRSHCLITIPDVPPESIPNNASSPRLHRFFRLACANLVGSVLSRWKCSRQLAPQ